MLRLIITSGLSLCQNRQLTSSKALNVKNKVFLLHVEPRVTHRGSRESSDHGGIAVEHLWNLGGFSLGGNCLVLFILGLQPPTYTQASFALSFEILDTAHELYRTKRCKGRSFLLSSEKVAGPVRGEERIPRLAKCLPVSIQLDLWPQSTQHTHTHIYLLAVLEQVREAAGCQGQIELIATASAVAKP